MSGRYTRREFIVLSGGVVLTGAALAAARPHGTRAYAQAATAEPMRALEANATQGGVLRTAWGATPPHYDIHQGANADVLTHLYDGLVTRNVPDGLRSISAGLASSWETSADGLTHTFRLRPGVSFSDGTPLTADDVVATFSRIVFPPEGMVSIYKDELGPVTKVEAVDPATVRFTLSQPWPPFMEVLSNPYMVVYSKKALDENANDLRQVIAPGTGPFLYVEHATGERWVFERNPNYWNTGLPYVDRLEMLHVPVWTDRGTAILTGQADFSINVSPQTWEEGKTRGDLQAFQVPCLNSHTAIINNQRKPFDDPRVRRAIHLAVSRQNMFQAIATQEPVFVTRWMPAVSPYATPAEQLATMPGYRADKEADIAEAQRLMAEAGYADGIKDVDLLTASDPQHAELNGPAFQDELRRTLNIEATIRTMERGLLTEEYKKGEFGIIVEGRYSSNYVDPTILWNANLKTGGSQNWSRYSNPAFDELLAKITVETDEAMRQELFNQGMALLDENPPFFLIGFCAHSPMAQAKVKGLALDTRLFSQGGRLETAWFEQ